MNSTKKNILIAISYTAILIVGMFLGPKFAVEDRNRQNGAFMPFLNGRSEKLTSILKLIDTKYVDQIETDSLKETAIDEILTHLDPHSSYLPPIEARLLNEDLEGSFYGIGIEYYLLNDTLTVAFVNIGGPAFKAGLERGDQILKIDNRPVINVGITGKQVVNSIRGKKGTFVNLLVKRGSNNSVKNVKIERDRINVSSIAASYMIASETGYIKIDKFGQNTAADFSKELKALQQKGSKNLIIDLRDNAGGYLSAATALADHFLGDKRLIVYTQGAHERRTNYWATESGDFEKGRLVILINENTASASEIVAGAVQDLDRGLIIGRRSFGKGLVQEQFDFGDGSALNLTVARYYTPSGRSIQKSYTQGNERYFDEVYHRHKTDTSAELNDNTDTARDQNSFKTATGRAVYGGGGIMPDIFVPIDTTGFTGYYEAVFSAGLINQYVYSKLVKRIKPASIADLAAANSISQAVYDSFTDFARSRGIKGREKEIQASQNLIKKDMRALLARYYFGDEGFYRIENSRDETVLKALQQFPK